MSRILTEAVSRRSFLVGAGVTVGGAFAASLLPTSGVFAATKPIVLRYSSSLPDTHPLNKQMKAASEAIKAETNGAVDLQVYANASMGGDTDMLSQVRAGAVDFIPLPGAILSTLVPAMSIESMPFAFKDYETVWAALDGKLGDYVRAQTTKVGLVPMEKVWNNGFRQITSSTRPINTPQDLAGFKLRVLVSPLWTSMFSALGAAPTGISINETYSALQTKVVDGQENPLVVVESARFYEVQKYCSLTDHIWGGFWILGSGKTFPKLPKDVQEIVSRQINAAALVQRQQVIDLNASLEPSLTAQGITFNKVDRSLFRADLQKKGFYTQWKQKYGDEAWNLLEQYAGQLS
ncbi:TRAP transporter substrate-binding protein [Pseudomonas sp. SDO5532_S415]|uniref:TRAP transporter substrate-binding protein n=1 Tax=Pseudomonas sp. Irchel 3A7 TaxID=2008913 RepID=UPI000BA3A3B6|nr:TRAP transporter substrate-binding protein [Pseudomonas sp. Irchel 3A7]